LNGAGAVPKEKGWQILQGFMSIFCPLNAVNRKIEGQEGSLPYVSQVCLLNVSQEGCLLIGSEDSQSALNLFAMPLGWRRLFCFEKQVRGDLVGLSSPGPVYISLRTVPMGWISAVQPSDIIIREAQLPLEGYRRERKPHQGIVSPVPRLS
jgi:hypothetical protein